MSTKIRSILFKICFAISVGMNLFVGGLLISTAPSGEDLEMNSLPKLEERAVGRWIELEPRRARRTFVGLTGIEGNEGQKRIHFRIDRQLGVDEIKDGTWATEIVTEDLDCRQGDTRLVAVRHYGLDGHLIGSRRYDLQQPQRILSFYQSSMAEICSGEYLFKELPYQHHLWKGIWQMGASFLKSQWRSEIPDRNIPFNDPPA